MRRLGLGLALVIGVLCALPAAAQAPGAPGPLYIILYKAGPAWKPGVGAGGQALGPHGAYMTRLAKEGTLIAGGPFTDVDGGMALMRAPDAIAARAILAADPAVTAGVMIGEVRSWTPMLGTGGAVPVRSPAAKP